jgi:hypothetical protein
MAMTWAFAAMARLMNKYAHKTLMATVQEQGFNVEEEETLFR